MANFPGYPPQPPQRPKSGTNVVLILVVAGISVFVIGLGIFVTLGVYGARRYVALAKTAEARASLDAFARGIRTCAATEGDDGEPKGLPESSPKVPASLSDIHGTKYASSKDDWDHPTFECAHFRMTTPQYFQYWWERTSKRAGMLYAKADLDGDGTVDAEYELPITCDKDGRCDSGTLVDHGKR